MENSYTKRQSILGIDIHIHPFINSNSIQDIVSAMDQTGLSVIGIEALDFSIFPLVVQKALTEYPNICKDSTGIRLPDRKYLLNAREYNTKEGFHILTIGYSLDRADSKTEIRDIIDNGLENDALVVLDHPFVDNHKTKTAGHISRQMEDNLEKLCREYPNQIALEWNAYCVPWMRKALMYLLRTVGHKTDYYNVNDKAEKLSEKLLADGVNIPVIADTDLHARTKRHLYQMGKGRILVEVEGDLPSDIVRSMKQNIFSGKYENIKNPAEAWHMLQAFCIPVLFPFIFKKPRA